MPSLSVILESDGAWPDLQAKDKAGDLIWLRDAHLQVAALAMGMASGKASVAIRVDLPDGRTVVAEWIVAEDGAGRELARGTELGEQTDGTLILRDARGWEVWRSPEPCPPQWSRLPR